jgi:hypothetical protein
MFFAEPVPADIEIAAKNSAVNFVCEVVVDQFTNLFDRFLPIRVNNIYGLRVVEMVALGMHVVELECFAFAFDFGEETPSRDLSIAAIAVTKHLKVALCHRVPTENH